MDTFETLMSRLKAMTEPEARALGERAGVPWGTLLKIKYGQTRNPGVLTVQKLVDQLAADSQSRQAP
jgi:predicted transcriptional regulator